MKKYLSNSRGFTIGELVVVFLIVSGAVLLLQPFIRQIHARSNRVLCANNLRAISRALYFYAKEHQREFPADLKTLYDQQYLADVRFMDCPATGHVETPKNPGYMYNTGLTVNSSSKKILVQDEFGNHLGDGKTVLYVNGAVVWEEE